MSRASGLGCGVGFGVCLAAVVVFCLPGVAVAGCVNGVFRVGASGGLPDCRAYEVVSPVEK